MFDTDTSSHDFHVVYVIQTSMKYQRCLGITTYRYLTVLRDNRPSPEDFLIGFQEGS